MKIFYIVPRFPYPLDKGDKLRAYHQIRLLSKNHDVYLYAQCSSDLQPVYIENVRKYCKGIVTYKFSLFVALLNLVKGLFTGIPFQVAFFYSKKLEKKIKNDISGIKPDIILCQLIRSAEIVRNLNFPNKIIDYIDVLSKGLERRLETSNYFMKSVIGSEFKRVSRYEELIYNEFQKHFIITKEDRDLLPFSGSANVEIIPNGIDTEYFDILDYEKEYDIIFSGNMGYAPNIDAANYIVKKILPIIKQKFPKIKVIIVGANPSPKVKSLKSKNVEIVGWVDDVRPYYAKSKLFLAPMQIGTGLQNKLLQAMAMGIPCITSTLSHKGIHAPLNETIFAYDKPEEYAECVERLLTNPDEAKKVSINGRKFVAENYSWENIGSTLNTFLEY